MMTEEEYKQQQRIGLVIGVVLHLAVLAVFAAVLFYCKTNA